ncbi:MAG: hypothetical protein CVU97_03440 [Firmicutes bacterium HGW-Firmicutes-21]|nr:MAG: hypothetical protein CVU97_03440 [Firmicutes bacterium HGW-Firmicutes-21]
MKKNAFRLLAMIIVCSMLTAGIFILTAGAVNEGDTLYVTQINKLVGAASGTVFTKAYNNTTTIKSSQGNFRWVAVIAAEPTSTAGVYRVTYTGKNLTKGDDGTADVAVTIPANGFIYTAHTDDSEAAKASGVWESSGENTRKTGELTVGQLITITGIDITAGTISASAQITVGGTAAAVSETESPAESPDESPAESPDESPDESPAESPDESPAESPDVSPAVSAVGDTSEDEGGLDTPVLIAIIVAGVLAIAVISYVIVKKKKQ